MPKSNRRTSQTATVTFRIDPGLKAALMEIAGRQNRPVGALLRGLVRRHLDRRRRRELEAEARRQSLQCAAVARNPESDEATLMRELAVALRETSDREDWK